MGLFGDSFAKKWRSRRTSAALEDAVLELSDEISSIKATIAKINAKLAVEARKSKTLPLDSELKKLELQYGGKVIDVEEPDEHVSSSSVVRN